DPFLSKPPKPAYQEPFAVKPPMREPDSPRRQGWETPPIQQVQVPRQQAAQAPPASVHRTSGDAELDFVDGGRPRFKLPQSTIWIGRETVCEIRFDPGDVMVSRKHASIRYEGGNYVLEDNKSFNGTLVNDQRISTPTPLYDGDRIQLGTVGPVLKFV